jgi:uncharacterized protein YjbJ (UPF0337 family)
MGTNDKISNKAQDVKGRVKEAAGAATDNPDLRRKGQSDQAKAAVKDLGERARDAAGDVKDAVGDAADRVRRVVEK